MFVMLKVIHLCAAVLTTWPEVPASRACPAAMAAVSAETDVWPAELVLAIGYHESRLSLDKIGSRLECGPMQVWHPDRKRERLCRAAQTDVFEAYQQGVDRLNLSRAFCTEKQRLGYVCALNVYACGDAPRCWKRWTKGEAAREFIDLESALLCNVKPTYRSIHARCDTDEV